MSPLFGDKIIARKRNIYIFFFNISMLIDFLIKILFFFYQYFPFSQSKESQVDYAVIRENIVVDDSYISIKQTNKLVYPKIHRTGRGIGRLHTKEWEILPFQGEIIMGRKKNQRIKN